MINLDFYCMQYGQKLGMRKEGKSKEKKQHENNIRDALAVLTEDGVYAMFVWLESKKLSEIRVGLRELMSDAEIKKYLLNGKNLGEEFDEFCENLQEIARDLDKLLFLKKILERTLTYALYHAKTEAG